MRRFVLSLALATQRWDLAALPACPAECPSFPQLECGLWRKRVYEPFLAAQKVAVREEEDRSGNRGSYFRG